jgi:amino acid adenylation domain-containing protein
VRNVDSPGRQVIPALGDRDQSSLSREFGALDQTLPCEEEVYLFPLSLGQERLWFMDHVMPGTALFNLNQAHRFSISLLPELLERSLNEVIRRHEMLRTTFRTINGEPMQVVAKAQRVRLPVIDLSTFPEPEREVEAQRLATEEARQPFDLARGPLLRTKLLRLATDKWIFLVTMHHIISDGWSMVVFWRELRAIWLAFASREVSPLPELSIQYGDFAAWQRRWLAGPVLQRQLSYWRKQLTGVHALELPHDRRRPESQTHSGALYHFGMSGSIVSSLRVISQKAGVTLFMSLLAVFQVVLYRYTGETDVTVGTYIAGRNRTEFEQLIGFFLNSIAMRLDLSGNPPFMDLLARVKDMTLDAYAHQDVPFAKLVEDLRPQRDLGRSPFFQVIFQMLNLPPMAKGVNAAETADPSQMPVERGTAIFDLTCTLWESGPGMKGHIEYNTDLFNLETIERFVDHFRTLLGGIAVNPCGRISALPLITKQERQRALCSWNNQTEYQESRTLTELFELQAAASPEAIAVIEGNERINFRELNGRANRLARELCAHGVASEVIASVLLERSQDVVVALLAIMKAGGAFLMVDPSYPDQRVTHMLRDARPQVVITKSEHKSKLHEYRGDIVYLDAQSSNVADQSDANLDISISPDSLAYVIYTSGSTGEPKGAAVEYKQVLNRLAWMWRIYPFDARDTCCQKTALNFVDSIWEILGPILQGTALVIVPDSALKDVHQLVGILGTQSVTRIWLVPSLLRALLENVSDLASRLPALRFWVTTGETLSNDLLRLFRQKMPNAVLYNLYGTSEIWDATWFETRNLDEDAVYVPIGFPIDNVQCYVLDADLEILPPGVIGELYVGGTGVARGYWNRPAHTASRFVPDPFSGKWGARLYRTGDLARWRADGSIEFVGRIDHQIKVRGFRVEPRELESFLEQHAGVAQAVVLTENVGHENRLHAYVVARPDYSVDIAELRAFIKERVPEALVPSSFRLIESLPLLPNGKLDRVALGKYSQPGTGMTEPALVPPENSAEEAIASIWRSVLNIEQVSVYDNFFDLGGHSLSMVKVHTKLTEGFAANISMVELFRYPTIRSLARFMMLASSRAA